MHETVSQRMKLLRQCRRLPDLQRAVDRLLRQIPTGHFSTYGDLADALGDRVASRWVGHYMLHHAHDQNCPCHRVVRADQTLGVYVSGRAEDKARRLAGEGVNVRDDRVTDDTNWFRQFRTDRPLAPLAGLQDRLRSAVSLRSPRKLPDVIAGVDVSYSSPTEAVAAYALVDLMDRELVWSVTLRRQAAFPYISGYLAFRELPILLEVIDAARAAGKLAAVTLVDGSGILHPRGAGVASFLGLASGLRTVGVTKKLLCGSVEQNGSPPGGARRILHQGRHVGAAVYPRGGGRRPLYVSPGHRINVTFAARLVTNLIADHKLPEPIYWADRLSRQQAADGVVGRR